MADIARRFNLEMLTLTGPIEPGLAAQGVDVDRDTEFMALVEPDTVRDAYRLQMAADTPVLVTATRNITPARLAHHNMEDRLEDLAVAAITVARMVNPQHILVEVGPCGLPLDQCSANSMKEHRDQYARVARVFEAVDKPNTETNTTSFDGYLLTGFTSIAALKAAIAGVRKISDKPIFASVNVDDWGYLAPRGLETVEDAAAGAVELGADVVGFSTAAAPEAAARIAARVARVADVPVLVELDITCLDRLSGSTFARRLSADEVDNPYSTPDAMLTAAAALRQAGVQFLRAGGKASPAYTAVLAAATFGTDVVRKGE